jgi:hypothetical protein
MKILTLSDLHWHSASKEITLLDLDKYIDNREIKNEFKFLSLHNYISIIEKEKPSAVLLAGDLTGDGSCGHGYHNACTMLLLYCELTSIPCLFIQGDHDKDRYYNKLVARSKKLQYSIEISGKACKILGIEIMGLSYKQCNSKRFIRDIVNSNTSPANIIIAHAALKRRTQLLEIPSQILITGHFDYKLVDVSNTLFISHANDTDIINYSVIDYTKQNIKVNYKFYHPKRKLSVYYQSIYKQGILPTSEGKLMVNRKLSDISEYEKLPLLKTRKENIKYEIAYALKFLCSQNYVSAIQLLHSSKHSLSEKKRKALFKLLNHKITPFNKISITMIKEYLGSSFLNKKLKKDQ